MSQKDSLLDNPVEFLREVRESFNIQQDVDAMKRLVQCYLFSENW